MKLKLEVADDVQTNSGSEEIDILIGADQYWKVATTNAVRLRNGPFAVETIFG